MGKHLTKQTFWAVKDLQKEITKRANSALNGKVGDYVVDRLKRHIQTDVYDKYEPVEYERRMAQGGLLTDAGEEKGVGIRKKVENHTLSVFEEAPMAGPLLQDEYTDLVHKPDALALVIQEGAINWFNNKSYPWTRPRPFMDNTQEYINQHYNKILWLLKEYF